jgi:23S rRNA-intervening sequence protein
MGKVERFEDLIAGQKARTLTREIYRVTKQGEFSTDYGLVRQIQRASVSIMSNVAEGFERGGQNSTNSSRPRKHRARKRDHFSMLHLTRNTWMERHSGDCSKMPTKSRELSVAYAPKSNNNATNNAPHGETHEPQSSVLSPQS